MAKKFSYRDSRQIEHEVEIDIASDFRLIQEHEVLTDQAMQSKPTTFFKDAVKRFSKNKASVAGAIILGAIILMAIIVPIADTSDISATSVANAYQTKLYPKLFDAGFGFWDGCAKKTDIVLDVDKDLYYEGGTIQGLPAGYEEKDIVGGIDGVSVDSIEYNNSYSAYGFDGYVRLYGNSNSVPTMRTPYFEVDLSGDSDYSITLTTVSLDQIEDSEDWNFGDITPWSLDFVFYATSESTTALTIPLVSSSSDYETKNLTLDVSSILSTWESALGEEVEEKTLTTANRPALVFTCKGAETTANLLLSDFEITSSDEEENETLSLIGFDDATELTGRSVSDSYYWIASTGFRSIYHSKLARCSFRYDTYEAALGNYINNNITHSDIEEWVNRGWMNGNVDLIKTENLSGLSSDQIKERASQFAESVEILNERCPLVMDDNFSVTSTSSAVYVAGTVTRWKALFLDASSMPKYLMGTDAYGRDMLKYAFSGIRTSLILGVITAAVCFSFGLIWGSIAGYFGGWTDILMERFTDILGGVPWIVVMTLAIILLGSNFATFVMALCLTGWIGTSSITRTQFYRFKSREYILAARTLGASDTRLIFRHILPNAVGTIITSSVLLVPAVIFDEATIAYLNLGLQGMDSFGVLLSDNQQYIQTYPFLIVFPSVIMALLMVSFNLFGNGLRDAFNPSLKGNEG